MKKLLILLFTVNFAVFAEQTQSYEERARSYKRYDDYTPWEEEHIRIIISKTVKTTVK